MTAHRLIFKASKSKLRQLSTDEFLWSPYGEPSSMWTTTGPHLEEFGPVPALHKDLVKLAVLVFLADRSSPRNRGGGLRWDRELELTVPVTDPDVWDSIRDRLEDHLHLLTGDTWGLTFEKQSGRRRDDVADVEPAKVVCLFSGGADSLAGAVAAHAAHGHPPVLLSHWDFNKISSVQAHLVNQLEEIWETEIDHHRIQMQRRKLQVGSEAKFPNEGSRRSRSLLFIALGLAAAAARGAELWICENGFTSVNPPLSGERRSSLTTRTTHPAFLDDLAETLQVAGLRAKIHNPFELKTKGGVVGESIAQLGESGPDLFMTTHSCGKPPRFKGFSSGDQCGVCFGCLVRRGSFDAAGVTDDSRYLETELRGKPGHGQFLTATRRKEIEAVRYRLGRRYSAADVLAMSLPARIPTNDALDVVNAGIQELKPVVEGIPA